MSYPSTEEKNAPRAEQSMLGGAVLLRAATPQDRALLFSVYASTREQEMARVAWSGEEKQRFLAMQFEAQDTHYRAHYAAPEFYLILKNDAPAGRLYLCRTARELRVMDLALLPAFRGGGIGGAIFAKLQAEARASQQCLTIHVEKENRARGLYARLGFVEVEDRGVYLLMSWEAPTPDQSAPH